ncbi:MAG: hypothetical protein FJ347_03680 [Sphingomonadales bacterium]|nr:hypothetical protein [Sphingomonadales bacterium]
MNLFILRILFIFTGILTPVFLVAQQDSGMSLLGDEPVERIKVENAFKTTRVINLQSLELTDAGVMDMKINHRFGAVGLGSYEAFGLDNASVRIGAEYGIIPNLVFNLGRSSLGRMVDAGLKYRIMHQTNDNSRPFTALLYGGAARTSLTMMGSEYVYTAQLIAGRKETVRFSWLVAPSVISGKAGQVIAVGVGFREKITPRTTLNAEYIPVLSRPDGRGNSGFYNSFSVGADVETGGHVFQLFFTNSAGMAEPQFIAQTNGSWMSRGFRFGFNISRVFTVVDPGKFR